ncbi:MAG: hypothetical protein HUU15_13830 [Candidatus Brocadiae bacterium]|nr:hypothetical protein [Candidatus Brocadiia bacterium]
MRRFLPLLALPLLAACTGSSVSLGFTVYPDKSGEYEQMAVVLEETPAKDEEAWLGGMQVQSARRLRVQHAKATFALIDACDVGGIRFEFGPEKDGFRLQASIPTTAEAGWVRRLAPSSEQIDRISGAMEKGMEGGGRQIVLMNYAAGMAFAVVSVQMPGAVREASIEGAPWKTEIGREEPLMMGGRQRTELDTAYLWIPLKEVHAGKTAQIVWRVSCGEITEERAFAWEQQRHRKAATEAEKARAAAMKQIADQIGSRMQEMALPERETGLKFVEALGVTEFKIKLRGPKTPVQVYGETEEVLVCEEPAEDEAGIYGVTRGGMVIWIRKGTKRFEKAIERTTTK